MTEKAMFWGYKGEWYTSLILEPPCSKCGERAIIKLEGKLLAEQTDGTTHVCHPLAGGCNHGFSDKPTTKRRRRVTS